MLSYGSIAPFLFFSICVSWYVKTSSPIGYHYRVEEPNPRPQTLFQPQPELQQTHVAVLQRELLFLPEIFLRGILFNIYTSSLT